MITTFYFIRHGEADNPQKIVYGASPVPLTKNGEAQIHNLALYLQKQNIQPDIILTSPIRRTVQTAEILQQTFQDTPLVLENDLREVEGDLSDMKISEILALGDYYHAPETRARNIEQPESIAQRMKQVIDGALNAYSGKTIFIVSHGDPLAWLIWELMHPNQTLPSVKAIQGHYPTHGNTFKIVFDEQGNVTQTKDITIT